MQTYPLQIAGLRRHLPICPISDELSIGAFVIFGDQELTVASAQALSARGPKISAGPQGAQTVYDGYF